MKTILLAFDGMHFSESAFEFVRKMNETEPVFVKGFFLSETRFGDLVSYTDIVGPPVLPMIEVSEPETVQRNITNFKNRCNSCGLKYRVYEDYFDVSLEDLQTESRYSDMMVLGVADFYYDESSDMPSEYLFDLLQGCECPVVLVPQKLDFPETIVLAYDGSKNAVHAIKQFTYLLPEMTAKRTLLVYADPNADADFPDMVQMQDWAAKHFNNHALVKLDIDPQKYFGTWISEKKAPLLVCGSFGRSGWSQWFSPSFTTSIMKNYKVPIFIAHTK